MDKLFFLYIIFQFLKDLEKIYREVVFRMKVFITKIMQNKRVAEDKVPLQHDHCARRSLHLRWAVHKHGR